MLILSLIYRLIFSSVSILNPSFISTVACEYSDIAVEANKYQQALFSADEGAQYDRIIEIDLNTVSKPITTSPIF